MIEKVYKKESLSLLQCVKMTISDDEGIIAVICRIYYLCGESTKCHMPREAVTRRLLPYNGKEARKYLGKAVNQGYIYEERHEKGRRSYGLTKKGLRKAREACREE